MPESPVTCPKCRHSVRAHGDDGCIGCPCDLTASLSVTVKWGQPEPAADPVPDLDDATIERAVYDPLPCPSCAELAPCRCYVREADRRSARVAYVRRSLGIGEPQHPPHVSKLPGR